VERVTQEVAGRVFAELRIDVETFWRDEDRPTLWISLKGADADALVGPRAQTLDALQYMMRALIHRQAEGDYNLVLDADGYRERRQRRLVSLAKKMADRAVRIERTVRLHPMPANERRIIHMTLREDPRVTTQSKGSGRRRAVSIRPQT
jgi:spoIIIJ-associated protein